MRSISAQDMANPIRPAKPAIRAWDQFPAEILHFLRTKDCQTTRRVRQRGGIMAKRTPITPILETPEVETTIRCRLAQLVVQVVEEAIPQAAETQTGRTAQSTTAVRTVATGANDAIADASATTPQCRTS
jgi:hypothetical protein